MSEVKWIKITTDMFEDEKIDYIESLPEADAILIIWVRLLTMAGKSNSNGYILLTEKIAYSDDMLAHKFKKPLNTVKLALATFVNLDMIESTENGFVVVNWEKHQNIDGLAKIKEQTRVRVANHRAKIKALSACNVTVTEDVTPNNATELELELDKDKDIKNKDIVEDKHKTKTKTFLSDSNEHRLATFLWEHIKSNNSQAKKPNLDKWAETFDLIIRIDKRPVEDIKKIIIFSQHDEFWNTNVLSPAKVRLHYDQLTLLSKKTKHVAENKSYGNKNQFVENCEARPNAAAQLAGYEKGVFISDYDGEIEV